MRRPYIICKQNLIYLHFSFLYLYDIIRLRILSGSVPEYGGQR